MSGGSHLRFPAVAAAGFENLFGVCGDDDIGEQRGGTYRFVDPSEERLASDLAQHLAGQASRGESSGNYGDGFHERTSVQFPATTGKCELIGGSSERRQLS